MNRVSNKDIKEYGSYEDREDSYDDQLDIDAFFKMAHENMDLRAYIKSYLPNSGSFVDKPFGKKGVDIGVEKNGEMVMLIDVERWNEWNPDWPGFYRFIHFLARKDSYLMQDKPFLMVFFNKPRTKVLIVDKETILQYEPEDKWMKRKQRTDRFRALPRSVGRIFGTGITDTESQLFITCQSDVD